MSNHVTSLLRRRELGLGHVAKSVALLMGDVASDDGTGIWISKQRMANELETTHRTIRRTIERLCEAGFVREVGQKKHKNGFTVEYAIDLHAVDSRPDTHSEPRTQRPPSAQDLDPRPQDVTPDTLSPRTHCPPTPDTLSPQDRTQCPPNPIKPKRTRARTHASEGPGPPDTQPDGSRKGRTVPDDLQESIKTLQRRASIR